mgnify:CR=1 FL=1
MSQPIQQPLKQSSIQEPYACTCFSAAVTDKCSVCISHATAMVPERLHQHHRHSILVAWRESRCQEQGTYLTPRSQ